MSAIPKRNPQSAFTETCGSETYGSLRQRNRTSTRTASKGRFKTGGAAIYLAALVFFLLSGLSLEAEAQKTKPAVTPKVIVAKSLIEGQAAATSILTRTVKNRLPAVLACYKSALKQNKGVVGELQGEISISPQGSILDVTLSSSSTIPRSLRSCSIKAIRGLKFRPWKITSKVLAILHLDFQLLSTPPKGTIVKGGLEQKLVAGVFNARRSELEVCLEKPPKKITRLTSTLNIQFTGKVKSANVSGKGVSYKSRKCMAKKILTWRFPASKVGHRTYAQYPLILHPTATRPRVGGTSKAIKQRSNKTSPGSTSRPISKTSPKWKIPSTNVTVTKVTSSGPRAKNNIERKLSSSWSPSVKSCIDSKMNDRTDSKGTLSLGFTISTQGRTESVSVRYKADTKTEYSTIRLIKECAAKWLKRITFRRRSGREKKKTSVQAKASVKAVRQTKRR